MKISVILKLFITTISERSNNLQGDTIIINF